MDPAVEPAQSTSLSRAEIKRPVGVSPQPDDNLEDARGILAMTHPCECKRQRSAFFDVVHAFRRAHGDDPSKPVPPPRYMHWVEHYEELAPSSKQWPAIRVLSSRGTLLSIRQGPRMRAYGRSFSDAELQILLREIRAAYTWRGSKDRPSRY